MEKVTSALIYKVIRQSPDHHFFFIITVQYLKHTPPFPFQMRADVPLHVSFKHVHTYMSLKHCQDHLNCAREEYNSLCLSVMAGQGIDDG